MPKRRKASLGYTVDGKPRTRRPAAVGAELERLTKSAIKAITAAGDAGLTRQQLASVIGAGRIGTKGIVDGLKANRIIHVTAWRKGQPAYGIGDLPDVPKPPPLEMAPRGKRPGPDFVEIAKREVVAAHAKWMRTWVPHRDLAAFWIGSPA